MGVYNQQGIPAFTSNTVIWVETGGVHYKGVGSEHLMSLFEYVIK